MLRESLPGIAVLGDRGDPAPFDCDVMLLSLPRLFKTRLETIPADVPYLHPPAEAALRWKARLAKHGGVKVGVVWAGNPEHVNDTRRSLELRAGAVLCRGRRFFREPAGRTARRRSRQADERQASRQSTISPELSDFAETAGAVAALDW